MDQITWSDFEKVEIRVGRIVQADVFPQARKPAYRLRIDFGELGVKSSSAQITTHYRVEELVGRLVLGVGVGSLEEEFALLGAEFADRGARGDDAIRAIRASFGREDPEYHGTHYSYSGLLVRPAGVQSPPPIWSPCHSRAITMPPGRQVRKLGRRAVV